MAGPGWLTVSSTYVYLHVCLYMYICLYTSTFSLFECYFGDGMQLVSLECPARLGQHQLSPSKEIIFKVYFGMTMPIM